MSEPWLFWVHLVQAALAETTPIDMSELLLVRDQSGAVMRAFEPAAGVVPREAAVLLLLYPDAEDLRLLLTVRSSSLPLHRGEVSLPGGGADPEDLSLEHTALREAYEEIGVQPALVEIWGRLSGFYIAHSNFNLTPVVGFSPRPPTLVINDAEVAAVLTLTLRDLLDPLLVREEEWSVAGRVLLRPFFAVSEHKVWGATAVVLSELAVRLRRVLAKQSPAAL